MKWNGTRWVAPDQGSTVRDLLAGLAALRGSDEAARVGDRLVARAGSLDYRTNLQVIGDLEAYDLARIDACEV